MKKELTAGILLTVLITGAFFNIRWLDGFTSSLSENLELSRLCMSSGDFESAETYLRNAIDKWNNADGYTHIFIRHSEIDSATDAFYELLSDVISRNKESAEGSYEKIQSHLRSIVGMERPTIGSIF